MTRIFRTLTIGAVAAAVLVAGVRIDAFQNVFRQAKYLATSTAADAVRVLGGVTAGSGSVGIIGTDGRIPALTSTYVADTSTLVPSNLVAFFVGGACPTGWSEYTTARGRVIVGLPLSGTLEGTAGAAQTDLETRVQQHTHAVNVSDPGHNHTQNAHTHTQDAHGHGVTDGGHNHLQNSHNHTQDAHGHGVTDPGHLHGGTAAGGSTRVADNTPDDFEVIVDYTRNTASATTGISINSTTATNQATTATNQSATTGISINNAAATNQNATATNNANTTGVSATTSNPASSVAGPALPYVQLLACRKS